MVERYIPKYKVHDTVFVSDKFFRNNLPPWFGWLPRNFNLNMRISLITYNGQFNYMAYHFNFNKNKNNEKGAFFFHLPAEYIDLINNKKLNEKQMLFFFNLLKYKWYK